MGHNFARINLDIDSEGSKRVLCSIINADLAGHGVEPMRSLSAD